MSAPIVNAVLWHMACLGAPLQVAPVAARSTSHGPVTPAPVNRAACSRFKDDLSKFERSGRKRS